MCADMIPFPFVIILKEARIAGCVTAADAYQFVEQKRANEAEQGDNKDSGQIGTSGKTSQRPNFPKVELGSSPRGIHKGTTTSFPGIKDAPVAIQAITKSLEEWDISDFDGAELLTESVRIFFLPCIFSSLFVFLYCHFFIHFDFLFMLLYTSDPPYTLQWWVFLHWAVFTFIGVRVRGSDVSNWFYDID
jgi:hypothetical protein